MTTATLSHSVGSGLLALCALLSTGAAHAQRVVVVNGVLMSPVQAMLLDQLQCTHVPNGYYWLNLHTGAWGYAGSPMRQGYLGAACGAG